jgi:hypothetical protein
MRKDAVELPFRVAVNLQRIDAADQIGAVANGSVEQVEDARAAHHAALREPDDLRSWSVSRNWHACCVDNRQAFFLWIGVGSAALNAYEPDGDGRLLSGAGSLFEVKPTWPEPPKRFPPPQAVWRLSPSATFC